MPSISFHTLYLGLLLLAIALTPEPASAHIAMLHPVPRGGVGTKQFNWRIHQFIGYEGFKYPCGGYPKGPVTELQAGQLVPVRFWATTLTDEEKNLRRLPEKSIKQARHGGGMCEFSLSYDGGKNFYVIATYTETCPDVAYEWPVRIPSNVPSCNKPGQCLFAWSWTAALVPQFYHNCADITMKGVKNGRLPSKKIQLYDFKGHKQGVTFRGDGTGRRKSEKEKTGPGPIPREVKVASAKKDL